MDISIIIPTKNRSDHVIKMLRYFKIMDFDGCVLIGDSSDQYHIDYTRRAIKKLDAPFEIIYNEYPNQKSYHCIRDLMSLATSNYAMWMCDDDILIPATLQKCAKFLEENPEYSSVGGIAIRYSLSNPGVYGAIKYIDRYPVYEYEAESSSQRLHDLLQNYTVVGYSLGRTEQLKRKFLFENNLQLTDLALATEMLPACMCAAQGKIKMLNSLFVVRQMHDQRYLLPDMFDRISKPDWPMSSMVMRNTLAEELVRNDGITLEEARDTVKQAFWSYLKKALCLKYQSRYGRTTRFQALIRKAFLVLKSRIFNLKGLTLRKMLNPSSPYHADFMPVYRVITTPPKDKEFVK